MKDNQDNIEISELQELAISLGMPVQENFDVASITFNQKDVLTYSFSKKNKILIINKSDFGYLVAISNPLNLDCLEELRFVLDGNIIPVFLEEEKLISAIEFCYKIKEGAASELVQTLHEEDRSLQPEVIKESYDLLDTSKEESPVIRLLNLIIEEAIRQKASDIHFEPFENDLKIRYRIDGVLHYRYAPPGDYQARLITRIKVLAKLDIAEHRLPQDGRMKLLLGDREIDFRVSTVPVEFGERVVLRILDRAKVKIGLDQIGMCNSMLFKFRELLMLSEGMVLVTGPTGSGKTTTIYSALFERSDDDLNIMTIEDPVEYKLPLISQIAVNNKTGLSFASGLRHILRQDPDIIMVGEIRDTDTAQIAIRAALTGHLMLSTLHTNNAIGAIARLMDMGIESYLISSTIAGVLAQRLVRMICSECVEEYEPTAEELSFVGISKQKSAKKIFYRGKGCRSCFGSGYNGRTGIYELLIVDDKLRSLIAQNASLDELKKYVDEKDFIDLRKQGIELIVKGKTTIKEILRVCGSDL